MENQLIEINKTLNELKSSQNKFNKTFEDILEQINKLSTENSELLYLKTNSKHLRNVIL